MRKKITSTYLFERSNTILSRFISLKREDLNILVSLNFIKLFSKLFKCGQGLKVVLVLSLSLSMELRTTREAT
jgi:hypothetical protein